MFEKLKEYSIYIILSLLGLGLLVISYLSMNSGKSGEDFLNSIQITMREGLHLSQIEKDVSTITKSFNKLGGKQIGKYVLGTKKIILFNTDGDSLLGEGISNTIEFENQLNPGSSSGINQLQLYLIPKEKIPGYIGSEGSGLILEPTSITGGILKEKDELKSVNEELRGFIKKGYLGLGSFQTQQEAEQLINEYFNSGSLFKLNDGEYGIMIELNV